VMIHRALFGSIERFFGVLLEHYAGAFPAWLAPVQVAILNITDRQAGYAGTIQEVLKNQGVRATVDLRNEKIGFKIREHTLQRVPYLVVVGDREAQNTEVAVRTRSGKDLGSMPLEQLIQRLTAEIASRGRNLMED